MPCFSNGLWGILTEFTAINTNIYSKKRHPSSQTIKHKATVWHYATTIHVGGCLCQADEDVVLRKLDTRIVELRKMGKLPNQNLGDGYVIGCPMGFYGILYLPYVRKHYVDIIWHPFLILYPRYFVIYPSPPPKIMFTILTEWFRGVKTDPNDLKWMLWTTGKWLPISFVKSDFKVMSAMIFAVGGSAWSKRCQLVASPSWTMIFSVGCQPTHPNIIL